MNATNGAGKHTVSLFVHNRPGVLSRIAGVFARRGFNIDSLVVSPGHEDGFSRMTIVSLGDPATLDQIIKQLAKLVDVVRAIEHLGQECVERELALFKIDGAADKRPEILQICEIFRGKTVDISEDSLTVEITGTSDKLDAFEKMLAPYGIREMVRSGKLIIARGSELT
jgi:acetolactate synthase-1/3 small subunit